LKTPTLYGISNCGTVKAARAWLAENGIDYIFHDFKKAGLDAARVQQWSEQVEWTVLLNRSGTTWRKLTEARKATINSAQAANILMCEQPSIVKRPVLEYEAKLLVGFDPQRYQTLFSNSQ
jgi:arsenate reductase